jgi:hypothetical protein
LPSTPSFNGARPLAISVNDGFRPLAPIIILVAKTCSAAFVPRFVDLFHGGAVGLAGSEPGVLPLVQGSHGY